MFCHNGCVMEESCENNLNTANISNDIDSFCETLSVPKICLQCFIFVDSRSFLSLLQQHSRLHAGDVVISINVGNTLTVDKFLIKSHFKNKTTCFILSHCRKQTGVRAQAGRVKTNSIFQQLHILTNHIIKLSLRMTECVSFVHVLCVNFLCSFIIFVKSL